MYNKCCHNHFLLYPLSSVRHKINISAKPDFLALGSKFCLNMYSFSVVQTTIILNYAIHNIAALFWRERETKI